MMSCTAACAWFSERVGQKATEITLGIAFDNVSCSARKLYPRSSRRARNSAAPLGLTSGSSVSRLARKPRAY